MIKVNLELVTPNFARQYLERNKSNRPLNKRNVKRLKDDILNGRWKVTTDCVGFNENGVLINGQHRLNAIIEANKAAQLLIATGLPNDSFPAIDNLRPRGLSDVLYIEGVSHNSLTGAIVRQKMKLDSHRVIEGGACEMTNSVMLEEYNKHKQLYDNLATDTCSLTHKMSILSGSIIGGYSAYLILTKQHPYQSVMSFFRGVFNVEPPTNGVQVELMRKLIEDKTTNNKMTSIKKQVIIIKAWNAYISGKTLKVLSYNEINDKGRWFI